MTLICESGHGNSVEIPILTNNEHIYILVFVLIRRINNMHVYIVPIIPFYYFYILVIVTDFHILILNLNINMVNNVLYMHNIHIITGLMYLCGVICILIYVKRRCKILNIYIVFIYCCNWKQRRWHKEKVDLKKRAVKLVVRRAVMKMTRKRKMQKQKRQRKQQKWKKIKLTIRKWKKRKWDFDET